MNDKYLQKHRSFAKQIAGESDSLPSIETIKIEAPLAYPGDWVVFINPRVKSQMDKEQVGKVTHLETHWLGPDNGGYEHAYHVKPYQKNYKVIVHSVKKTNP